MPHAFTRILHKVKVGDEVKIIHYTKDLVTQKRTKEKVYGVVLRIIDQEWQYIEEAKRGELVYLEVEGIPATQIYRNDKIIRSEKQKKSKQEINSVDANAEGSASTQKIKA
jgi:hypothetical protein